MGSLQGIWLVCHFKYPGRILNLGPNQPNLWLLEVWSPDQQYGQHLGACWKFKVLGHPGNQWSLTMCSLQEDPRNPECLWNLRSAALDLLFPCSSPGKPLGGLTLNPHLPWLAQAAALFKGFSK